MRVEIADDVTWRDLAGEVVILNLATGVYFGLDGAGEQMWHQLVEQPSLEKAFESLKKQFDVDPKQLRRDLEALLQQLAEKGLVRLNPESNPRSR
jgi:hypothetical protein